MMLAMSCACHIGSNLHAKAEKKETPYISSVPQKAFHSPRVFIKDSGPISIKHTVSHTISNPKYNKSPKSTSEETRSSKNTTATKYYTISSLENQCCLKRLNPQPILFCLP